MKFVRVTFRVWENRIWNFVKYIRIWSDPSWTGEKSRRDVILRVKIDRKCRVQFFHRILYFRENQIWKFTFFYGIRFQILFSWKRGLLKGKSYSIYSTCFRFKPLTVSLVFSQQLTKFKYEGSTRKKGNVNFSEFWILHFSYCVMLPCVLIITGYVLLIWMKISCSFMVITRNCGAQCTFHFSQSNLTHYILLRIIKKS